MRARRAKFYAHVTKCHAMSRQMSPVYPEYAEYICVDTGTSLATFTSIYELSRNSTGTRKSWVVFWVWLSRRFAGISEDSWKAPSRSFPAARGGRSTQDAEEKFSTFVERQRPREAAPGAHVSRSFPPRPALDLHKHTRARARTQT